MNSSAVNRVRNWLFVLGLSPLVGGAAEVSPEIIHIPAALEYTEEQYAYFSQVLELALEKASSQPVQIQPMAPMQIRRQMVSLDKGYIDVNWSVTNAEREKEYIPVYFPVAAGLYGYRIFLVNKQFPLTPDLSRKRLQSLKIVQGKDWPDTLVLRSNGFEVLEEEHHSAFQLLSKHFVDVFPRSVTEIFEEARQMPELNIDPYYVLYYDNPVFFFTAKNKPELAERIGRGLHLAFEDGSLLQVLHNSPFYQKTLRALAGRKVIVLQAPISDEAISIQNNGFLLAVQDEIHQYSQKYKEMKE